MATFTEEFKPLVQEFLLVFIHNYIGSFSDQHKTYFFEIFEYGGVRLKTDHFKLSVSLETLLKCHM